MKVKFGLRTKFTLLFFGFMILLTIIIIVFLAVSYLALSSKIHLKYGINLANQVSNMVEEETLVQYAQTKEKDTAYYALLEDMKQLQKSMGVFYLYIVFVETEEAGMYFFDLKSYGNDIIVNHELGEENASQEDYPGLKQVLEEKTASRNLNTVEIGDESLVSVYAPICNEENEVIAFIGVDFNMDKMADEVVVIILQTIGSFIFVVAICFLIMLLVMQLQIIRPIYQLKKQAELVSEGKFEEEFFIKGRDEFAEIATVFHRMAKNIAGHIKEVQEMNDAYDKHVPFKMMKLLHKENIVDVKLGNETNAVLGILSFQLADFDKNIRKKSTKEMFDFINHIFHVSVPAVMEAKGTIESFQNAGFTAVYDHDCEGALTTAVSICRKMNHMVTTGQLQKNHAGIGIAFGPIMVGIVGQEKRMSAITISQYRDMACWLQAIAAKYQSHILITKTAADEIPDFHKNYHVRTLGFLYNAYTGHAEKIYDVYDGDSTQEMKQKESTKEIFETGVECYLAGQFQKARQAFISVLKQFRKDKAAKEYLYLCDQYCESENIEEIDIYFTRMGH